jgi:hypothetical protein
MICQVFPRYTWSFLRRMGLPPEDLPYDCTASQAKKILIDRQECHRAFVAVTGESWATFGQRTEFAKLKERLGQNPNSLDTQDFDNVSITDIF